MRCITDTGRNCKHSRPASAPDWNAMLVGNITYGFLEENAGGSGNATYGGRYFTNVAPTGSSFIVPQGNLGP